MESPNKSPQEENRIRVEAPSGVGLGETRVKPSGSFSLFYLLLLILGAGCSVASLYLVVFSQWDSIKGAFG